VVIYMAALGCRTEVGTDDGCGGGTPMPVTGSAFQQASMERVAGSPIRDNLTLNVRVLIDPDSAQGDDDRWSHATPGPPHQSARWSRMLLGAPARRADRDGRGGWQAALEAGS
jgi:hypothetical protein